MALYRINKWEALALLFCIGLTLLQYYPVFLRGYPQEPESAWIMKELLYLPWMEALFTPMHYTVLPVPNWLIKWSAHAAYWNNRALSFLWIYVAHFAMTWGLLIFLRKLINEYLPAVSRQASLIAILAALLFTSFNAYYHLMAAILNGNVVIVAYALLLHTLLVLFEVVRSRNKPGRGLILYGVVLAVLMPLTHFVGITFLFCAGLLFATVGVPKKRWRPIGMILGAHFAALFTEVILLDARVSPVSIASKKTAYTPGSVSFIGPFLDNPVAFLASALHNALSGIEFGLLYQNFLLGVGPWSLYCGVGLLALALYAWSAVRPEVRKVNLVMWALILGCLLNASLMRNGYTGGRIQIFDSYFFASMPRYYYFPSALLAISMAISGVVFFMSSRRLRPMIALLGLGLIIGNSVRTHQKIEYLGDHMSEELFEYVPEEILRAPPSQPGRPSFRSR